MTLWLPHLLNPKPAVLQKILESACGSFANTAALVICNRPVILFLFWQ